MDAVLRAFIRQNDHGRCAYCRVHQNDLDFVTFHMEHIIAEQHGGGDDFESVCLACPECNLAKGPNLAGWLNDRIVPLFHPRR